MHVRRGSVQAAQAAVAVRNGGLGSLLSSLGTKSGAGSDNIENLGKVTRNRRTAKRISRNKEAVKGLITDLNANAKFSKLSLYAVECFKNLAVDEVSIEEMIEEGSLESMLKFSKLHPYDERIQQQLNKCFKQFAHNDYVSTLFMNHVSGENFAFSSRSTWKPTQSSALAMSCKS